MQLPCDGPGPYDSLKCLLLDMAKERTVEPLLRLVVERLGALPDAALARIWLMGPGDVCASCRMEPECPDRTRCLHLVASCGRARSGGEEWRRIDGDFRRFPIGVRKVGQIAATAEPLEIADISRDGRWAARPEWVKAEDIRGVIGQPLLYGEEVLGVLVLFLRDHPDQDLLLWLRMIADHAATAVSNARAFEEIQSLRSRLELENLYLREEVNEVQAFGELVGASAALRNILEQIQLVAPTDASVLILGESGTGKELVAREIHERSARAGSPMIRVNCPSIPRELYESEFFGHARGAFTGASKDRAGRFEAADGGTLFLDEVGEIPFELQSKLLRVLQEGHYERLGEERTRSVDVRIIAATNRDLKAEVEAGRFRQDLYYRLNVFPLEVAPLRERVEDVPPLATHFAERAAKRFGRSMPRLTQANVLELQRYDWPGNVRELQNVIERAVIASPSGRLDFELGPVPAAAGASSQRSVPEDGEVLTDAMVKEMERDNLISALERAQWKIYGEAGAAALLEIKPTTLASRMRKLGIRRPEA